MSVHIAEVDAHEARDLILRAHGAFKSDLEIRNFNECLSMMHRGWAGYVDGKLICVWALCPPVMLSDTAYLWMYHTENVRGHEFILVRHSQIVMEQMLRLYPRIEGRTAIDNPKAIRWLQWLGAEFAYSPNLGWRDFKIERRHG